MSRTQRSQQSPAQTADIGHLPRGEPDFAELVREQARLCPDKSPLEIAEEVAELFDSPLNVCATFAALDGQPVSQNRLYSELIRSERWEDVKSLVRAHQIRSLFEDKELISEVFRSIPADVGQILANELVTQSYPSSGPLPKLNRAMLDVALSASPAEYLAGLSEEGLYALRERFGLNHVAPDRFKSLDKVLERTIDDITTMTGNAELGRLLVDQMLTYPRSHFEKESKTRHGLRLRAFNPEELEKDLAGVTNLLDRWARSTSNPRDFLDPATQASMLRTLRLQTNYDNLPETFKHTIDRQLVGGAQRLSTILRNQERAEITGFEAEKKAKELLMSMETIVAGVYASFKYSDSDMMGRDLAVLLWDGRTVYLDIKSSDVPLRKALDGRTEFANHMGLPVQFAFLKNPRNESGPGQVYRHSRLVIVDPRDADDEQNRANLFNALMPED